MFFKNNSKINQETRENRLNFDQITTQLRPLVKLLQIEGAYSIVYNEKKTGLKKNTASAKFDHPYRLASWKWARVANFYSYAWKAVMISSLLTFQCNVLEFPFPLKLFSFTPAYYVYTKAVGKFSNDVSLATTGCLKTLELFVLQWNSYLFVRWLNNWNHFEREFCSCFSKSQLKFNFDIRNFCYMVVALYVLFEIFVWAVGGLYFASIMFECRVPYFSFAILVIALFALYGHHLTEDLKVFIILKTNLEAYEQIRCGISKNKNNVNIDSNEVIGWRSLITISRQQTILLCKYLKSQLLITVVEEVVSCTLGLFYLLSGVSEGNMSKVTSTFYTLSLVASLYLKIVLGERIPAKELQIAEEVMEIEEKCCEPAAKIELKFLHEMLKRDTLTMNLGNYCFLDKQLLLQVGVQVVTYLIVILQFQGINKIGL